MPNRTGGSASKLRLSSSARLVVEIQCARQGANTAPGFWYLAARKSLFDSQTARWAASTLPALIPLL
jgi:hypothetical protein